MSHNEIIAQLKLAASEKFSPQWERQARALLSRAAAVLQTADQAVNQEVADARQARLELKMFEEGRKHD